MIALVGEPLTPDPATARGWAREELAHAEYRRDRPSLLSRALTWLMDRLDRAASATGLTAGQLIALVLFIAVVVVVVIVLLRRQVRLTVARGANAQAVLGRTTLSAAEHRARAEEAERAGRYAEAVLERMRAIARRLEERGVLDPRPGRTADELARDAGLRLTPLRGDLLAGARVFDDVTYGSLPPTAAHAARLRDLDLAVEGRPVTGTVDLVPTGQRR